MKKLVFAVLAFVLVFAVSCSPEAGHEHTDIEKVLVAEPTENSEGYYVFLCHGCNKIVEKEIIPKMHYAELFVPDDVELEEMDASLVDLMSRFIKNEVYSELDVSETKSEIVDEYVVKDVVFKENATVNGKTVKSGSGSISYGMVEKQIKAFLINSTINLNYSDGEHGDCEIAMNFQDTVITAEWDAENKKWINPRLADKSSFECIIDPKDYYNAESLYPSVQDLWDFCEAFFTVSKFEDILTKYEAEFTTKKIFRDKNGSLLYRYAFVTLFDSESMDLLEFNNGKVKLEGKEYDIAYCIDDAATLNCKYIRIDGKFYNPDKLNQSLRQK